MFPKFPSSSCAAPLEAANMTLQNLSPRNEECSPQGNGLLCMLQSFCPPEIRGLCTQPKKKAIEQVVSRGTPSHPSPSNGASISYSLCCRCAKNAKGLQFAVFCSTVSLGFLATNPGSQCAPGDNVRVSIHCRIHHSVPSALELEAGYCPLF